MINIEIVILTCVVSTLFVIFIFGPLFYAQAVKDIPHEDRSKIGLYIIKTIDRMGKDKTMSLREKKKTFKGIRRTMADMETDGVYFPEYIKEEIKQKEVEICQYSGLPTVNSYEKDK